ncbi:uncharacterized protein JCM15063_003493 [Sporobolomyces koalae]|uniref:uncharacterized protein n=1 Tax=Sporobolomyces koalae TaxID=500713 RepID=UPI0031710C06
MPIAGRITRLSTETSLLVSSGIVVPSFPAIVAHLTRNALQAHSTSIQITFDLETWSITCTDNGDGIPAADLELLAERHSTSKRGALGQALDSIQRLAWLELTTQTVSDHHASRLVRRNGDTLELAPRPGLRLGNDHHGTTVAVRDIFHNYPVRRKALSRVATVQQLRQQLETTALAHPNTAFHLSDMTSSALARQSSPTLFRVQPSTQGSWGRWNQLWGRASIERVWQFDRQFFDDVKVTGFISFSPSHGRSSQFIFVDNEYLMPTSKDWYKTINHLFAKSTFSRHSASALSRSPRPAHRSPTLSRNTPKKSIEKYPVYLFKIESHDDRRHEDEIELVLAAIAREFLVANGYLVEHLEELDKLGSDRVQQSPLKRSAGSLTTARSDKRIASTLLRAPTTEDAGNENSKEVCSTQTMIDHAIEDRGAEARAGLDKYVKVDRWALKERTGQDPMPEWLQRSLEEWNNPVFPIPKPLSAARALVHPVSAHYEPRNSSGLPFTSSKPSLASLNPSCHKITQTRISKISKFFSPTTTNDPSLVDLTTGSGGREQSFTREDLESAQFVAQVDHKYLLLKLPTPRTRTTTTSGRMDIDRDASRYTLVMLDQHAVSERIRVERFLEQVCHEPVTVDTLGSSSPALPNQSIDERKNDKDSKRGIGIVVSKQESRQLGARTSEFRRWGISYSFDQSPDRQRAQDEVENDDDDDDYVQVWVETVPKVVGDRLRDARTLQELVRAYLAQLEHHAPIRIRTTRTREETSWIEKIKDCPEGLIELINSKACRGSIMFNDQLSDAQGRDLVEALKRTKLPFVCAHGRPSIVPLVNVESNLPNSLVPGPAVIAATDRTRNFDWDRLLS